MSESTLKFARKVAQAMGPDWSVTDHWASTHITGPDHVRGLSIAEAPEAGGGRLEISGLYPEPHGGDDSITILPHKAFASNWAAIQKFWIDYYLPEYDRYTTALQQAREWNVKCAAVTERLLEAFPALVAEYGGNTGGWNVNVGTRPGWQLWNIAVRGHSEATHHRITATMMPTELVRRLLLVCRDYAAEHPTAAPAPQPVARRPASTRAARAEHPHAAGPGS
jgi:hypothetical protein